MASENASNSNQLVNTNLEVNYVDGKPKPLLEVNNHADAHPHPSSPCTPSSTTSSDFGNVETDFCDDSSPKSEQDGALLSERDSLGVSQPQWSMISASPRAGSSLVLSQELSPQNPDWNAMKSPPVQTMGRPGGYDPNRIPASIFSTKKTGAADWSVASNESLFSIHMGNNSFSRDHAMFLGKSGELQRIEEWNNAALNANTKSVELNSFPSSLPPVFEGSADEENRVGKEDSSIRRKMDSTKYVEGKPKDKSSMSDDDHLPPSVSNVSDGKVPPRSPSSPARPSDDSGNSSSSFAFPVLVNDGGKAGSLKSVTEEPEKTEKEKKCSDAPCKIAGKGWFSCFSSCWPPRCR